MLAGPRDTEGCSTAAGQFVPQTIMEHDGKDTEAALITGPRAWLTRGVTLASILSIGRCRRAAALLPYRLALFHTDIRQSVYWIKDLSACAAGRLSRCKAVGR